MLRALLALLTDGRRSYTVAELAARLGTGPDAVRLATSQLEGLGLISRSPCSAGGVNLAGCRGCPVGKRCHALPAATSPPLRARITSRGAEPGDEEGSS